MFSYLISLFHRALNNWKLTPRERAFLKAIQGAVIGFLASLAPQLINVYVGHGHFNITDQAVNTILTAFALYIIKLWSAQSDAHIGDLLDPYMRQLEEQAINQITPQTTAEGTTQIPAIHLVIPSYRAVGQSTYVQASAPEKGTLQPNNSPTIQKQFIAPPTAGANDQPTLPVPVPPKAQN